MADSLLNIISKEYLHYTITHREVGNMPANTDKQAEITSLSGCHNVISDLRTVMSGSVMQLEGTNLAFDKQDIQQGLFLIDLAGEITKVSTIVRLKTDNIIFMVPGGIKAGLYKLELHKRYMETEKIHTSTLPSVIKVII